MEKELTCLVAEARSGDSAAFGELFKLYSPQVIGAALGITKDKHKAEDIAQDAFVVAWRKLRQLRHPSSFGTWVAQIARMNALMSWRSEDKDETRAEDHAVEVAHRCRQAEPAEPIISTETAAIVMEEINGLPHPEREIVLLMDIQGVSAEEAAKSVGLPPHTVRAKKSYAWKKLCERLSKRGIQP